MICVDKNNRINHWQRVTWTEILLSALNVKLCVAHICLIIVIDVYALFPFFLIKKKRHPTHIKTEQSINILNVNEWENIIIKQNYTHMLQCKISCPFPHGDSCSASVVQIGNFWVQKIHGALLWSLFCPDDRKTQQNSIIYSI